MDHPENSEEYKGLQVNAGVSSQSIVNPYLKRGHFRRREYSAAEMVEGIIKGDVTILSQAVTLVESVNPKHYAKAQEVIDKCLSHSGNPSPTAGSLGGVARKTRETIILCEAAGFDKIFVETVGVGQSETACHSMVDFFLLIQLAGTGDELQGIKRGIMEIADGIVINKCDGENVDRCKMAATNFRNALHFFPMPESGWLPKVLCYSGFYGYGIKEVWDMIYQYIDFVKANGYFQYRRNEQSKYWMYESINENLRNSFYNNPVIADHIKAAEQSVLGGEKTSFKAAGDLLDMYFKEMKDV